MQRVSPEVLRDIFCYEPDTGKLFWKERAIKYFPTGRPSPEANMKRWNKRHAGKEVTNSYAGYLRPAIFGKPTRAHLIIWAMVHGYWPDLQVDHVNGNSLDNRLCNLRLATPAQNKANRGANRNSSSRHVGVSWIKAHQKWRAQIEYGGRNHHLGYFTTEDEAASVYQARAVAVRGEWARRAEE